MFVANNRANRRASMHKRSAFHTAPSNNPRARRAEALESLLAAA